MSRALIIALFLICFLFVTCKSLSADAKHDGITALQIPKPHRNEVDSHGYEIVGEEIMYSRWRSIVSRRIRQPKDGKIVEYDVSFSVSKRYLTYVISV